MDALASPHGPALSDAVDAGYAAFNKGWVSPRISVCLRCMGEDTPDGYRSGEEMRAQLIATPVHAMSPRLLARYTDAAHHEPNSHADLRALLPRTLDLIAQDECLEVTGGGLGVELAEFGGARRHDPGFLSRSQRQVLDDWMRALMLHMAWMDAMGRKIRHAPGYAVPMLIGGGWPADDVLGALEAVFDDARMGLRAAGRFALAADRTLWRRKEAFSGMRVGPAGLDWFALRDAPLSERVALAAWLNGERFQAAMEAVALSDLPDEQTWAASILHAMVGEFDAGCMARPLFGDDEA